MFEWSDSDDGSISSCETVYSDKIDSDVEAELYGMVHHQEYLSEQFSSIEDGVNNCENSVESSDLQNGCESLLPDEASTNLSISNSDILCTSVSQSALQISREDEISNMNRTSTESKIDFSMKQKSYSTSTVESSEAPVKVVKKIKRESKNGLVIPYNNVNEKLITVDSSDSDSSIIWRGTDEVQNNIKTNLTNDTINLSLSSSGCSFPAVIKKSRKSHFDKRNMSMPNIKFGETSSDLWYTNEEDCYRSNRNTGRYHERILNCTNCKSKGHSSKNCDSPKALRCFICGGEHIGNRCRNKICGKCHRKGHDTRRCWEPGVNYCLLCYMKGHLKKDCPDIWRRYHLTTHSTEQIVKGKALCQDRPLYCFHCGEEGHFGPECRLPRIPPYGFPMWSAVVSYGDSDEKSRSFNEKRKHLERSSHERHSHLEQNENWNKLIQQEDGMRENRRRKKRKVKRKLHASKSGMNASDGHRPVVGEMYFPRAARNMLAVTDDQAFNIPLQEIKRRLRQEQRMQRKRERKVKSLKGQRGERR